MKEIICPYCGKTIPISELQPAADLAICRTCEESFSITQLISDQELADVDLDTPPKHVTLINAESGLYIVYRRIPGIFWFLLPFTCVWSGGSVGTHYIVPFLAGAEMPPSQLLFGIPFLIGTLILLTALIYMLFGCRRIGIHPEESDRGVIEVFTGVGKLGITKRIRYQLSTTVALKEGSMRVNNEPLDDICIRSDDDELRFGPMLPEPHKRYIAALIQASIGRGSR